MDFIFYKMKFVWISLFVVFFVEKIFAKDLETQCPKNWFVFQDSCYMIISIKTFWLNGYLKCENLKSEYLSIESTQEAKFIHDTLYYIDSDVFFYTGAEDYMKRGFLKWFRRKSEVPIEHLCEKNTRPKSWENLVGGVKKAGVYDVENKCIKSVDANRKYHAVCERNCTNFNCLKLKAERFDTSIFLPRDQSCNTNNCENNSTCTPVPRLERGRNGTKSPLKYRCRCLFGFEGDLCERDTRACFIPPLPRCRNNATCIQSDQNPAHFMCECFYGFKGTLCEENILCENVTCLNGGICMNGICNCGPYFSGNVCEVKADDLVVLETFSKSVSALAVTCVMFYVILIVSLDALKYLFHVEPTGLDQHRRRLRIQYALKRIGKEKDALSRRIDRLDKSIKKLRDYRFHYLRWRGMRRFIDDPTSSSTGAASSSVDGGVSTRDPSYFSSFSIQKLATG